MNIKDALKSIIELKENTIEKLNKKYHGYSLYTDSNITSNYVFFKYHFFNDTMNEITDEIIKNSELDVIYAQSGEYKVIDNENNRNILLNFLKPHNLKIIEYEINIDNRQPYIKSISLRLAI
jgi:hypothetical protein